MQINELTGIKNVVKPLRYKPEESGSAIGQDWYIMLRKHGFQVLGNGSFGSVWSHPNQSYLLKVFAADDVAYVAWARAALRNKSNPAFPKFKGGKIIKLTSEVLAIRMEPLVELSGEMSSKPYRIESMLSDYGKTIYNECKAGDSDKVLEYLGDLGDFIKSQSGLLDALLVLIELKSSDPDFSYDLHAGNAMMRGNTMVITDPLTSRAAMKTRWA